MKDNQPFLVKNEEIHSLLIEDLKKRNISPRHIKGNPEENPYKHLVGSRYIEELARTGLCSPKTYFLLLYHFEEEQKDKRMRRSIVKEENYYLFLKK